MSFTDQIVAGIGVLIREFIQSPNYVAGVSGWSVMKDGSAEFNDLTIRGTVIITSGDAILIYDGPPAVGNLLAALSGADGVDSFGNSYLKGLTFRDATTAITPSRITFGTDANFSAEILEDSGGDLVIRGRSASAGPPAQLVLTEQSGATDGAVITAGTTSLQFGSGSRGRYYYEEIANAATNLATGTTTTLKGNVVKSASDYSSAYDPATGAWTCPVTGEYDHVAAFRSSVNATGAGRSFLGFSSLAALGGTVYLRDDRSINNGNPFGGQLSLKKHFTAGDVVFLSAFQTAVAAGALTSVADSNLWTVRRCL